MARLPTIYTVRASDAVQPAATLQEILQKLKMETRIADFMMLEIEDSQLSPLDNMEDGDLLLILLTYQLQSERTENKFDAFKTNRSRVTVAEIIIDNVPYENSFITFPADFRPIRDRDDMAAAWTSIEQSLKDMFPAKTEPKPEPIPPQRVNKSNRRLEAVENHPEFPALLAVKPSALPLYGRFGWYAFVGVIFFLVGRFISTAFAEQADGSFQTAFSVLLLCFSAVGIGITVWAIFRLIKLSAAKLSRPPALIVDKRISIRSSRRSTSTTYYITLELDDGERRELEAIGKLYGKVTNGDAGVAYIQDVFLLDYRRLADI